MRWNHEEVEKWGGNQEGFEISRQTKGGLSSLIVSVSRNRGKILFCFLHSWFFVLRNWCSEKLRKTGLSLVCLMCCVHFLHENMNYLLVDIIVLYCLVLKHAWLIYLFLFCLIWCSVVVSSLYMSSSLCFYVTVFYCVCVFCVSFVVSCMCGVAKKLQTVSPTNNVTNRITSESFCWLHDRILEESLRGHKARELMLTPSGVCPSYFVL